MRVREGMGSCYSRRMGMRSLLLLASFWLVGCDKSLFDQMTSGAGCRADDGVAGVRGRCPNDRLVCEPGWFDRDGVPSNGCEGQLQASGEYSLFKLNDTGLAVMDINEYRMDATANGGWVAMAGPTCTATPETPCRYDLLALQIHVSDFTFDSLLWSDGLIELPKQLAVTDDGMGLSIPAGSTFTASFMVDGKKRVVSQGTTHGKIQVAGDGISVVVEMGDDLRLPFGGYTVQGMNILGVGGLVAPR